VDGRGERATTCLYFASSRGFTRLATVSFPHSLGYLYSKVTSYLGFQSDSDEGKVMGLAAYGHHYKDMQMKQLVHLGPGFHFEVDMSYFAYLSDMRADVSEKFENEFGIRREPNTDVTDAHAAIAHALQSCLEEALEFLGRQAHELTSSTHLCLAGGTALNAVANARLMEELPFEGIYVQPAASDDGSALGAAFLLYHKLTNAPHVPRPFWSPYLGYEASESDIKQSLLARQVPYQKVNEPEELAALLLSKGYVIGWYQDRAEFGPRALGNRSILAPASPGSMKDRVNAIKQRENFRPFAPAVLLDEMPKYFEFWRTSPYMTFAYRVKSNKSESIEAVVHADGTVRVQTVEPHQNKKLHRLLTHYKLLTGQGIILNTSLNGRGEPLANTPADAVTLFQRSDMDALFMDDYLVVKSHVS